MPKFNRISLMGSEELFRPTRPEPEPAAAPAPVAPADEVSGRQAPAPVVAPPPPPAMPSATPPLSRRQDQYRIQLSAAQVQRLVEGIQLMKYPHQVRPDQKPSIEEFEELEALRNVLLDAVE